LIDGLSLAGTFCLTTWINLQKTWKIEQFPSLLNCLAPQRRERKSRRFQKNAENLQFPHALLFTVAHNFFA
jgi:hypothetical protein